MSQPTGTERLEKAIVPPAPPPLFFLAGGTTTGLDHLVGEYQGSGNQDAWGRREILDDQGRFLGIVGITCDGCGSTPDSATGSRAAVRLTLNIGEALFKRDPFPTPEEFAEALELQLLEKIRALALPLASDGNDLDEVIYTSYLFTMIVAVVTPTWTAVIASGDGVYAVNGNWKVLEPFEDNHPQYLAYKLMRGVEDKYKAVKLRPIYTSDTKTISSIVIGTDGFGPAVRSKQGIEGFRPQSLWLDPAYRDDLKVGFDLVNLNTPRRELRATSKADGSIRVELDEREGVFHDDCTVLSIVRNSVVTRFPDHWLQIRKEAVPLPPVPVVPATPAPQPAAAASTAPKPAPKSGWDQFLDVLIEAFLMFFGKGWLWGLPQNSAKPEDTNTPTTGSQTNAGPAGRTPPPADPKSGKGPQKGGNA